MMLLTALYEKEETPELGCSLSHPVAPLPPERMHQEGIHGLCCHDAPRARAQIILYSLELPTLVYLFWH